MRYKSILGEKVKREQAEEEKEKKLKNDAGIESDNVTVRIKGAKDYIVGILRTIFFTIFIILIFIGIVTIINPTSRYMILQMLQQIMA